MINNFWELHDLLNNGLIKIQNKKLNEIILRFAFIHLEEKEIISENEVLCNNLKESNIAIINKCFDESNNSDFFIICFRNTIIYINQISIFFLKEFLSINPNLSIYSYSNMTFNLNGIEIQKLDDIIIEKIEKFNSKFFLIIQPDKKIGQILKHIQSCISSY